MADEELQGAQPSSEDLSDADLEKLRQQYELETTELLTIIIKLFTPREEDGLGR